ncbi:MAG: tRNA pseudouridine(13) synthase TruD [Vibrionaceae bacterium]
MVDVMSELSYLHGEPAVFGKIKAQPDHFWVNEVLSFTPSGSGEHFLVRLCKEGENTVFIANELAKACGVASSCVSWAGLKDRHAVTQQWFGVHLPGKPDPDLSEFLANNPGVKAVLETARHHQKLRPGDASANEFRLVLSDIQGDQALLEARLQAILQQGVPNYFGEQRFGKKGNNIKAARDWGLEKLRVRDRTKRSFYLSAARSYLFNQIVSQRIVSGYHDRAQSGDIFIMPDGTWQWADDEASAQTLQAQGGKLSGPLTGDNALPTRAQAQAFEQQMVEQEPALLAVIKANRMQHDRRALLLFAQQMRWQWLQDGASLQCVLEFTLPSGAFATAVVRELIKEHNDAHSVV